MTAHSSPRISPQDAIAPMPDPNEITRLLMIKGQQPPTYHVTSRESTPDVTIGINLWIERIEGLQKSISYLDNTFHYEEWRQNNVLDGRYWRIEADHWESCYATSLRDESKLDRSWQEADHLRKQQAESNICFFRDISQFDWLTKYDQIITKTPVVTQEKGPALVFDIAYHCHRASYWANLHREGGSTQTRHRIGAVEYWQAEFTCLNHELLRLERKPLHTKPALSHRMGILKRRMTAQTLSIGSRVKDRKLAKTGVLRRSARLRQQSPTSHVICA